MSGPLRLARALGVLGVALLLGGCGQSDQSDGAGLCPASVMHDGFRYGADSRFGTPLKEGRAIKDVKTVSCKGRAGQAVHDAVAIVGIPVTVAFYAPDAHGGEFILIRDDKTLTAEQRTHLTGG